MYEKRKPWLICEGRYSGWQCHKLRGLSGHLNFSENPSERCEILIVVTLPLLIPPHPPFRCFPGSLPVSALYLLFPLDTYMWRHRSSDPLQPITGCTVTCPCLEEPGGAGRRLGGSLGWIEMEAGVKVSVITFYYFHHSEPLKMCYEVRQPLLKWQIANRSLPWSVTWASIYGVHICLPSTACQVCQRL